MKALGISITFFVLAILVAGGASKPGHAQQSDALHRALLPVLMKSAPRQELARPLGRRSAPGAGETWLTFGAAPGDVHGPNGGIVIDEAGDRVIVATGKGALAWDRQRPSYRLVETGRIADVAQGGDGSLWLAFTGGPSKRVIQLLPDGSREIHAVGTWRVRCLSAGTGGRMWACGGSKVIIFDAQGARTELSTQGDDVWDLAADGTGGVWVAHDRGIEHRRFDEAPVDALYTPDFGEAREIGMDEEGQPWFALRTGLLRRSSAGDWLRLENAGPWQERVLAIADARHGRMCFASETALWCRGSDDVWDSAPQERLEIGDGQVRAMAFDEHGALWIASTRGLRRVRLPDGESPLAALEAEVLSTVPGALAGQGMRSLALSAEGSVYLGHYDRGVSWRDADGDWHALSPSRVAPSPEAADLIRSLEVDESDALWIGHRDGVRRISADGGTRDWLAGDEIGFDRIHALHRAANGRTWVGGVGGVALIEADDSVRHLMSAEQSTLYLWLADGTVLTGDLSAGAQFERRHDYALPAGYVPDDILDIAFGLGNRVHVWYRNGAYSNGASSDLGAARTDGRFRLPDEYAAEDLAGVAISASNWTQAWYTDGRRSAGSRTELDAHESGLPDLLPPGFRADTIVAVAENQANRTWVLFEDGRMLSLPLVEGGEEPVVWNVTDSLPDGVVPEDVRGMAILKAPFVRAIELDEQQRAWIATDRRGLIRLDSDFRVENFSQSHQLSGNHVRGIDFAPDGRVWISVTYEGVDVLEPDGNRVAHYGREQVRDFNEEPRGVVWDSAGDAYLATSGALLRLSHSGTWELAAPDSEARFTSYVNQIERGEGDEIWLAGQNALTLRLPSGGGGTCADALDIGAATYVETSLAQADEVHVYRFDVDEAFSRVQLTLTDPDHQLELLRTCGGGSGSVIGPTSGSGRHIGVGRYDGSAHRHAFLVGGRTGDQYIAVRRRAGTRSTKPVPYSLSVDVTPPLAGDEPRTLILTHAPLVEAYYPREDVAAWLASMDRLAQHPQVNGLVVSDLLDAALVPSDVRGAFEDWQSVGSNPAERAVKATDFAEAIGRWVMKLRREDLPFLRFVVLAGDDRVLPHARLRIEAPEDATLGWRRESEYMQGGAIDSASTIGSSLLLDWTLSDDAYGAADPLGWGGEGLRVGLPTLAVGRLVEGPDDMRQAIGAYLERDGQVQLTRSAALGYDFMEDAARSSDAAVAGLTGLGETDRRRLLGVEHDVASWLEALGDPDWDLGFFAAHGSHHLLLAPDDGGVEAAELQTRLDDTAVGRVVVGTACHAGLNVPGAADEHTEPTDFPEVWLRSGATYLGSSGWAYGLEHALQYQEDLSAEFARRLVAGGGTSVGEALVEAKREYFWARGALDHFHAKTLAGTILYGLPMTRLEAPQAQVDEPPASPWRDVLAPVRVISPSLAVRTMAFELSVDALSRRSTKRGDYFQLWDRPIRPEAGQPAQPRLHQQVFAEFLQDTDETYTLEPRGLVWLGGTYSDHASFPPFVVSAGQLGIGSVDGPARLEFEAPSWYPTLPVELRALPRDAESWIAVREAGAIFTLGQYHATTGTERVFDSMQAEVFYSSAADDEPPVMDVSVDDASGDGGLDFTIRASDDSGIQALFVTWSDDRGRWRSTRLGEAGDGRWQLSLPAAVEALVQGVDGAGNVVVADDEGRHYRQP